MKRLTFAACALLLLPLPAAAKPAQCYSQAELEAEMLVRLHSELMVVTLSCRTSSTGESLPAAYHQFTQTNLESIKGSEKLLMDWYRRVGAASPEAKFDRLRTLLANDYSHEIATLSPPAFCAKYRDHAVKAGQWAVADVGNEVQNLVKTHAGQAPLCGEQHADNARQSQ